MAIVTTDHGNCISHVDGEWEIEISKGDSFFLLNVSDEEGKIDQWFVSLEQASRLIPLLQKVLE